MRKYSAVTNNQFLLLFFNDNLGPASHILKIRHTSVLFFVSLFPERLNHQKHFLDIKTNKIVTYQLNWKCIYFACNSLFFLCIELFPYSFCDTPTHRFGSDVCIAIKIVLPTANYPRTSNRRPQHKRVKYDGCSLAHEQYICIYLQKMKITYLHKFEK